MRVLVVDCDQEVRRFLGEFAEALGHEAVLVGTGAEAIRHFTSGAFDVILVDSELPDIDGFDLIGRVGKKIPAIVPVLITGTEEITREKALARGVTRYLKKPFIPDELEAILVPGV